MRARRSGPSFTGSPSRPRGSVRGCSTKGSPRLAGAPNSLGRVIFGRPDRGRRVCSRTRCCGAPRRNGPGAAVRSRGDERRRPPHRATSRAPAGRSGGRRPRAPRRRGRGRDLPRGARSSGGHPDLGRQRVLAPPGVRARNFGVARAPGLNEHAGHAGQAGMKMHAGRPHLGAHAARYGIVSGRRASSCPACPACSLRPGATATLEVAGHEHREARGLAPARSGWPPGLRAREEDRGRATATAAPSGLRPPLRPLRARGLCARCGGRRRFISLRDRTAALAAPGRATASRAGKYAPSAVQASEDHSAEGISASTRGLLRRTPSNAPPRAGFGDPVNEGPLGGASWRRPAVSEERRGKAAIPACQAASMSAAGGKRLVSSSVVMPWARPGRARPGGVLAGAR